MKVGIIILSWNSKALITECLDGLLKHEQEKVYVVDNDSKDGSADFIAKTYPEVKLIRSEMNLGFSSGNNLGIRYALLDGCDAVFLLNNDTIIDEPFLEPCVNIMKSDRFVGIVGPVVVEGREPEIIQCRGGKIKTWTLDFPYLSPGKTYKKSDAQEQVDYVLGAAMLIRREVVEQLEGLDPEYYPAYIEEADLCYRAAKCGYKTIITDACRVRHLGEKSSGGKRNTFRRLTANRFLFGLKHLDFFRFFIAAQIIVWKTMLKKIYAFR